MNTPPLFWQFYRRTPVEVILITAAFAVTIRAAVGTVDYSATGLGLALFLLAALFVAIHSNRSSTIAYWSRRKIFLALVALSGFATLFMAFTCLDSTHAQLLQQTSDAICSSFESAGGKSSGVGPAKTAVKAVFWILRGMMLLWIAFTMFQLVQNRDDQEKMQQIIRNPLMILLGTVVCDVAALFVIGAGGTTC